MNVHLLQWFLISEGYNVGAIDGIIGSITRRAIARYQQANGLTETGDVTAEFVQKYLEIATPTIWPKWLQIATNFLGLEELPGEENQPTIINWAKLVDVPSYKKDSTAWCGLFVGAMLKLADGNIRLPQSLLRARSFENFGTNITIIMDFMLQGKTHCIVK